MKEKKQQPKPAPKKVEAPAPAPAKKIEAAPEKKMSKECGSTKR